MTPLATYRAPPLLHYLVLGTLLQSLYGTQVCPYVETLSFGQVMVLFGLAFGAVGTLRRALHPTFVLAGSPWDRPRREMILIVGLHLAAGFAVGLYDTFSLEFPA